MGLSKEFSLGMTVCPWKLTWSSCSYMCASGKNEMCVSLAFRARTVCKTQQLSRTPTNEQASTKKKQGLPLQLFQTYAREARKISKYHLGKGWLYSVSKDTSNERSLNIPSDFPFYFRTHNTLMLRTSTVCLQSAVISHQRMKWKSNTLTNYSIRVEVIPHGKVNPL